MLNLLKPMIGALKNKEILELKSKERELTRVPSKTMETTVSAMKTKTKWWKEREVFVIWRLMKNGVSTINISSCRATEVSEENSIWIIRQSSYWFSALKMNNQKGSPSLKRCSFKVILPSKDKNQSSRRNSKKNSWKLKRIISIPNSILLVNYTLLVIFIIVC